MKLALALIACASAQFAPRPWMEDNFDNLNNWNVKSRGNNHNQEKQYYSSRSDNVRVENGILKIIPRRESPNYKYHGFTSGKLESKFHKAYGKIEIMAKTPNGKGLWPAIWMMPKYSDTKDGGYGGWPRSGEIDIYEGKGSKPNEIISTIHYGDAWNRKHHKSSGAKRVVDTTTTFHKYTLEWTPQSLVFKFDDQYQHKIDLNTVLRPGPYSKNGEPFHKEFYLILNVAVGGHFVPYPNGPPGALRYPQAEMHVKSVKWYEYTGGSPPVVPPTGGGKCRAKRARTRELCSNSNWACYQQSYAPNMRPACNSAWRKCCEGYLRTGRYSCNKEETMRVVSAVYEQYDSQVSKGPYFVRQKNSTPKFF